MFQLTGVPVEHGEHPQVVRYPTGGYYTDHCDADDVRWIAVAAAAAAAAAPAAAPAIFFQLMIIGTKFSPAPRLNTIVWQCWPMTVCRCSHHGETPGSHDSTCAQR